MSNEFKKFSTFVYEATGSYLLPQFADSFQDVFIYVSPDKKLPEPKVSTDVSCGRSVPVNKYFVNFNQEFSKLVFNEHWASLEDHLGPNLLRFCFSDCILAKRTKSGSFMVSKMSNMRSKISPNPPQKLNKMFFYTSKYCKEILGSVKDDAVALSNDKQNIGEEDQKNLNHLLCSDELDISTDNILFKMSKNCKFLDDHVLSIRDGGKTACSQIINTRVGNCRIIEYNDCIQPLEQILRKFSKLHRKCNYQRGLDRLINPKANRCNEDLSEHQNFGYEIPTSILKKYFADIFGLFVPMELFGSHKNRNNVMKSICDLLEVPQRQSINLKPYILKMRIADMHWLDNVKNTDTQWSMVGKLFKWLYNNFILEIFRTQLFVTVTNTSKKMYFMQNGWRKRQAAFIRKMCKDEVIARINGLNTKVFREGRWILLAKKNGIRPIMSKIKGSQTREAAKMALTYLQQLYVTKYSTSGTKIFLKKWKELVEKVRNNGNKTVYLVCCDINHAYGSINQKKLIRIVESLMKSSDTEVIYKWYRVAKDLQAVKSDRSKLKKYFEYPKLELPIASKSIFTAPSSDHMLRIDKELLLREIRLNVLNQNILISKERYLLQKGIAQGAILSSVLCNLYYAHMESTHLGQFKEEGFLYRYVDDFLFATPDKALAKKFLEHVNEGFPDYECRFNAAKTRTNLPGHEHTIKDITFLGFNIDPQTLEISPEYSKKARYSTVLSKPRYFIMIAFRKRLSNLASLKLDGLILDSKINSEDTIIRNIKSVFLRQAERCLWLVRALFDDISRHCSEILQIIRSTNLKIIRHIERYFLTNGHDFEKLVPRLLVIPWKSYRAVFGRIEVVYIHFRKFFLESIKLYDHIRTGAQNLQ